MGIQIESLDDIEKADSGRVSEWVEVVRDIDALESKAAAFVVEKVGDELAKFKKAFRAAANKIDKSAVFGVDAEDLASNSTRVQVKLVEKKAGRPVGSTNTPKDDAETPAKKSSAPAEA